MKIMNNARFDSKKRRMISVILGIVFCAMLGLSGCTETKNAALITDVAIAKQLLPGLDEIEAASWCETEQGSGSNSRVPGPTDYMEKGYVVISEENANALINQYELEECDVPFDSEDADIEGIDISELKDLKWYTSSDFSKDMVNGTGYNGGIYISGQYIWFVLYTN